MQQPSDPADPRRFAPSTARNREPILQVLRDLLPTTGRVLEIASGAGEHAAYFADHFPDLTWQPSDADPEASPSIAAWAAQARHGNVKPPLVLDVARWPWPLESAEAVICINMVHISPWACTEGLMRGAGAILQAGGLLYLYGPYRIDGQQTAPSNEQFEQWLKSLNPEFGVRDLADVQAEAARHGLELVQKIPMPSNNFSLVLRKN